MLLDAHGQKVKVGSMVKILRIDSQVTDHLPIEEVYDIHSMLNQVFEVYQIDEYGCVWVEKWFQREEGQSESHSISLTSSDFELVN